jgi:hypothetical protein
MSAIPQAQPEIAKSSHKEFSLNDECSSVLTALTTVVPSIREGMKYAFCGEVRHPVWPRWCSRPSPSGSGPGQDSDGKPPCLAGKWAGQERASSRGKWKRPHHRVSIISVHRLVSGSIPVKWAATPLTWATSENSAYDGSRPVRSALRAIDPFQRRGCRRM